MQYSAISSRITCLYGSQPLSMISACKTATFGTELQVFMGPRHDLSFCAYKTAWLESELLVSMSPISHVWFLDAKQRLLDRNNKSLWVPDITCHCMHENSVIRTRISSLYVSQTSSVVLSTHNSVLNTKIKNYIGSSRHLWFCTCKTATLGLELQVSVGPRPNLWFLRAKQRILDQNNKSLWVPDMTFRFVHVRQRD